MKLYTRLALLPLLLTNIAQAGDFVLDVGLGVAQGMTHSTRGGHGPTGGYDLDVRHVHDSRGPFAKTELGYEWQTSRGTLTASWLHMSSVTTTRDHGVDFLGVSYRFTGKNVGAAWRDFVSLLQAPAADTTLTAEAACGQLRDDRPERC